jgi:maleylpyruvate isomerase
VVPVREGAAARLPFLDRCAICEPGPLATEIAATLLLGCQNGTVRSVEELLRELAESTDGLLAAADGLSDADVIAPSLLPGWTRGHVLSHLARNAEGGTRLLDGARTGVPGYEYLSVATRAADIERGAGRPAADLAADVRQTAEALATSAAQMPPGAWLVPVTWTTGQQTPAETVVQSRLAEVLIHRVDLGIGYEPASWPTAFVREMLDAVIGALNGQSPVLLAVRLEAADTGRRFQVGGEGAARRARGMEAGLLAWLLGRSAGIGLVDDGEGPLPTVPSVYQT